MQQHEPFYLKACTPVKGTPLKHRLIYRMLKQKSGCEFGALVADV